MAKLLRKGLAKDGTYICFEFQCSNGIDTFFRRFVIKEEHNTFLGYGYEVRTPDFFVEVKGTKYACFWADGKNIKIQYDKTKGIEFDGLCFKVEKRGD